MPTLRAAGRILSAAIMLALSGDLPFNLKDGSTQSSDLAYGGCFGSSREKHRLVGRRPRTGAA